MNKKTIICEIERIKSCGVDPKSDTGVLLSFVEYLLKKVDADKEYLSLVRRESDARIVSVCRVAKLLAKS